MTGKPQGDWPLPGGTVKKFHNMTTEEQDAVKILANDVLATFGLGQVCWYVNVPAIQLQAKTIKSAKTEVMGYLVMNESATLHGWDGTKCVYTCLITKGS